MTEQATPLQTQLAGEFGEILVHIGDEADGMLSLEVAAEHWLDTCRKLRDAHGFTQLTDLCGVDHLFYGLDEWDTEEATREGFSRGVEGIAGPGRFDWEARPQVDMERRYEVVVHLLNMDANRRLRISTYAPDGELPAIPSLVDVWPAANWFEREAFDLYGIAFDGHPDLRRILTDYGFVGHPFRKDFPLVGNVEMRYDEEKGRVIYQPVTIEPRVLVPKTIRDDSRYLGDDNG